MIRKLTEGKYDSAIEASDWRYSAVIYGMNKYFTEYFTLDHEIKNDCLYFNDKDITEEKFLLLIEKYYCDEMHHMIALSMLNNEEFSEEHIKTINEKLTANTVLKKIFKDIKFDGNNASKIIELIDKNKNEIIKETFRFKTNLYRNYCNTNSLFTDSQLTCRLVGYNIDVPKKGRSSSYNFDSNNMSINDSKYFDFIPLAFTGNKGNGKNRESFFINDNSNIEVLLSSNNMLENKVTEALSDNDNNKNNTRGAFFYSIIEAADFIDYDVEVIQKDMNKDYFESLYIRKESINILKELEDYVDYKALNHGYKINENYYINIFKEVMDSILNQVLLDNLIELLIKGKKEYIVSQLIKINLLIKKGGENMKQSMKAAYACAKEVNKTIQENKIESYKNKLISAIVFKDRDRVCDILMQLSNYSKVKFDFAYSIFDDFDENKELIYTFVNTLGNSKNIQGGENNE